MAMPLICPQGHQWEPDAAAARITPFCPICGRPPLAAPAAIPTTLNWQPQPDNLNPPPGSDTPSNMATLERPRDDNADRKIPLLSQHIPGYDLLGELGRGGMGVVYKARQTKLNRIVALKMVLAGAQADSHQLERFRAEAEAVARLQHPFIVQIYEISEHEGCPFFSLEFVDGGTLAEKLNGVPQPPRLAAQLIRLLAQAVHSAHQKGIIHRDLKPGNILLAVLSEHVSGSASFPSEVESTFRLYGIPKITDFGLAKHLDTQSQTRTGAILGTPSYMAPEQAEGRAHTIGPATDVYGLGAILYEMLTGRPPFESESSLTTIRQLLTQEPISPIQLHRKVPRDLETICLKCLEKDPARRYASAEDLAEDLHRFLSGQPIEARPANWINRAFKWMRRHPTWTGVSAAAVVAVVTLVSIFLVYHFQLRSAVEEARANAEDSRRNLVRLHVAQGTSAMNAGDGFTALLWFTEALRLDADTPEHDNAHRQRIAALEQGLPRLEHLWIHEGAVMETRFSPDGRRVLTAGEDGKVHLWDSETGKMALPPLSEASLLTFALFSRDGRRIAAGGNNGMVRVWDAVSGKAVTPPLRHGGPVRWIDFSPDGRQIAAAGGDQAAHVWDAATGQLLAGDLKHGGEANVALFSPDGRSLATAGDDGLIRLWDAATRQETAVVAAHDRAVLCLAFSPDGKRLASGSSDRTAQVWDAANGAAVGRRLRHHDSVLHVVFSPHGERVLTSSEDGTACLWRVADGERVVDPLRHKSVVRWSAFSADGCRVATAGDDNSARMWSADTGAPLTPPLRGNGSVNRVAFSPDGRRLAVASDDGTARVWDVACRHQARVVDETAVFRRRADRELGVASLNAKTKANDSSSRISPDGQFILKIADDNTARVYRRVNGEAVTPPLVHRGEITYAAFSADGRRVVTTSQDQTARVWDAANGVPLSPPLTHASGIEFADFSPEGRRLVTASDDNSARVWDIDSGALLVPPLKHDGTVLRAVFDAEGRRVATGSLDQTARVWDAETGQALTPPLQHPWSVERVYFDDDGSHLRTSSGPTGAVWSWNLPCTDCAADQLIQLAQLLSGSRVDDHRGIMPLTPSELKDLWTALRRTRGDLLRFSSDHVTAWHRQTTEECMRGRHWSAAVWHLNHLIQAEPENWLDHARRGRALAELGRWKEAGDDFGEVVRRAPDEAEAHCMYAVLRLYQGDTAAYRNACAALLKSPKNDNPRLAYLAAWTCLLSADAGVKGERLAELAKQAVEREPNDAEYLCTLGAALFRAGDLKTAEHRLNEALDQRGRRASAREWLWLAMVRYRRGLPIEAREWLHKAAAVLDAPETASLPWIQRLQLQLLRREVERLLK